MNDKSIVLYFQLHQPYRAKRYTIFDTAHDHVYFNDEGESNKNNKAVFERVTEKSYRPMTELLEKLLHEQPDFRFSLSITGVFLEQAVQWAPDVIESVQRMVASGRVELLSETYYHSLAFFHSKSEFETQVALHREAIFKTFGVIPSVFRNTELAYNDELASWAAGRGYKTILAEGWDAALDWRSPNHVYRAAGSNTLALMLKNYRLSDDLAFRFSDQRWAEWPLTAGKYIDWLHASDESGTIINLFMDFETFGEHQQESTGIFQFFADFVKEWNATHGSFSTISQAVDAHEHVDIVSMPQTVTWADAERDLSAWNGNELQKEALRHVYDLEHEVIQTEDTDLIADWRKLLTSDHFYYMATKRHEDGNIHAYFSPYDSPYDAFLSYMNVIRDIRWRIMQHRKGL